MRPYLALIAWRNVSFMLSVAQCVSTLVTAVKMEFVAQMVFANGLSKSAQPKHHILATTSQ